MRLNTNNAKDSIGRWDTDQGDELIDIAIWLEKNLAIMNHRSAFSAGFSALFALKMMLNAENGKIGAENTKRIFSIGWKLQTDY